MNKYLWVPGQMPGLNELVEARFQRAAVAVGGKRWNAYSDLKRSFNERIAMMASTLRFSAPEGGYFTFICREPDARRDPDNVLAGAMKIILDGLKKCDALPSDSQRYVFGFSGFVVAVGKRYDNHVIAGEPGVTIICSTDTTYSRPAALSLDELARKRGYRNDGKRNEEAIAQGQAAARAGNGDHGPLQAPDRPADQQRSAQARDRVPG